MPSALAGIRRTLAADLPRAAPGSQVQVQGWVHRRRVLATVTFLILRDRSGFAQVVIRDQRALHSCGAAVRKLSSRSPALPHTTPWRRAASR
jgi:aspartyl-tRNA synthetase